ncbi:MAG: glycosyltransferase [Phycisphaerales bacterium]|nr:glycosyltransferase [Phycisphaerales bacterium]
MVDLVIFAKTSGVELMFNKAGCKNLRNIKHGIFFTEHEWETKVAARPKISDASMHDGERERGRSKDLFRQKGLHCRREILLSLFGLLITLVATGFFVYELIDYMTHGERLLTEGLVFLGIALGLIYGNVVYQLTRIGYFRRLRLHVPEGKTELDSLFMMPEAPALTVLVPSYKEDREVIRRTLLSAALQEYPYKKVVLLIDNPPNPTEKDDLALLHAARQLPITIQDLLDEALEQFSAFLKDYEIRLSSGVWDAEAETETLLQASLAAAEWFEGQAKLHSGATHSDALFVQLTYMEPARAYYSRARHLEGILEAGGPWLTEGEIRVDYLRLASRFQTSLSSFERKKYINLSHEANKAMNLNSYIGLLGRSLREADMPGGVVLEPCGGGDEASIVVASADFLITLDADSILAPDYALRLIAFARRPENSRVAIMQTPYSAEPDPPTTIERIAGATTDMQYLIHQGFTHYGATFWVGANALIRTAALGDLCVEEKERGYLIQRFIQDRTVIEDTESSVDLAAQGWQLYNYPERLSYSATPGDYGALLIQRRRWANGGLIILPKLLKYLLHPRTFFQRMPEGFFRIHYLVSIAIVNVAVLVMLFFPFERPLRSLWFPLTCVPYFMLYGRDLMHAGYRFTDLFRVYALNLLLVPVNLGGVFKSVQQALAHKKIPFSRTPKVSGRTAAPMAYLLVTLILILYCLTGSMIDFIYMRWFHAAFALGNATFLVYALVVFIGLRALRDDLAR